MNTDSQKNPSSVQLASANTADRAQLRPSVSSERTAIFGSCSLLRLFGRHATQITLRRFIPVVRHQEQTHAARGTANNYGDVLIARKPTRHHRVTWIRGFLAVLPHRFCASDCGNCWTLVVVCPKKWLWGFAEDMVWLPSKDRVSGSKSPMPR